VHHSNPARKPFKHNRLIKQATFSVLMNDIYIELKELAIAKNVRFSTTSTIRQSVEEFNPEFRSVIMKTETAI
jgi:hypothetical protein